MALILNIDTALDAASLALAKDNQLIGFTQNNTPGSHATWIHQAIRDLLHEHQLTLQDLDAIAVSNGPGSYTGLRIGLSTAKGLCFALKIPLLCINTLQIMASAVKNEATDLICAAIDARRMEIFTATYDKNLKPFEAPSALILNKQSFTKTLTEHSILFVGNGIDKIKTNIQHKNALFSNHKYNAMNMLHLAEDAFIKKKFSSTPYAEPYYVKSVYIIA